MTMEEFAKTKEVGIKTVKKWVTNGLIPGANADENYIPPSARIPYTRARAKNAKTIYKSIVRASSNRLHVLPKLYGMCQDEFDGYIHRLENAGLIELRVSDGITYYDATIEATKQNEKYIMQTIDKMITASIEFATTYAANKLAAGY